MPNPPKSIREHKASGNYRESRHGKDGLPVEQPEGSGLPGQMSPHAQAFWNVITANLEYAGFISRIDGPKLRLAADAWADYVEACEELQRLGMYMTKGTKYGEVRYVNPAYTVKTKAWDIINRSLSEFGMSPRMRTGLRTELPDADDEEELARSVFGGF